MNSKAKFHKQLALKPKDISLEDITRFVKLLHKRLPEGKLTLELSQDDFAANVDEADLITRIEELSGDGVGVQHIDFEMELFDRTPGRNVYKAIGGRLNPRSDYLGITIHASTESVELQNDLADWGHGTVVALNHFGELVASKKDSDEKFLNAEGRVETIGPIPLASDARRPPNSSWSTRHKDGIQAWLAVITVLGLLVAFAAWQWPR